MVRNLVDLINARLVGVCVIWSGVRDCGMAKLSTTCDAFGIVFRVSQCLVFDGSNYGCWLIFHGLFGCLDVEGRGWTEVR